MARDILFNNRYRIIDQLGVGCFGNAFKVKDEKDKNIPIKVLKVIANTTNTKIFMNEIGHLKNVESPFFIRYFDGFHDERNFYIVTELCEVNTIFKRASQPQYKRGDLNGVIIKHIANETRIEHSKMKKWTIEILEGLEFLHNKNVVHFDIKPENIFLDELERVKVGDLGIARDISTITMGFKGTPCYVSPQLITGENINEKTDIWSFGCVVYEMIELEKLFPEKLGELFKNIKSKPIQIPENIDNEFKVVLNRSLERDETERASAKELLKLLKKQANELTSKIEQGLNQLALVKENDKLKSSLVQYKLGMSYFHNQDYDKAIKYLTDSLDIMKNIHKADHIDIAKSLNNIGMAYEAKGDLDKALEFLYESLNMRKRIHKEDHNEIATSLNNIGMIYENKGDLDQALKLLTESHDMKSRIPNIDDTDIALSLNNLGMIYKKIGDLDQALKFYGKSLDIWKRIHHVEHIDVARCLNNIGMIHKAKGDLDEALKLFKASLDIKKRIQKVDHTDIATSLNNIGAIYKTKGDLDQALKFLTESLDIRIRIFKADHKDIAIALNNVGTIYKAKGDSDTASQFFTKSDEMRKRLSSR